MANEKGKKDDRTKNETQRQTRRRNRNTGIVGAEWSTCDPILLARVVSAITRQGMAIQFGTTRDGGSLVVRIVGDGSEPYNEYVRATEDIDAYLLALAVDFED